LPFFVFLLCTLCAFVVKYFERNESVVGSSLEVLVFEVGGQRYGLPAADVRELTRAATLTPLPRAPRIVEGVINLRGTIVPILDIRARFGLPPKPMEYTDHFVVAQAGARLAALRIDRAIELIRVDAADVAEAQTAVPGVEYVTWVAKLPHCLVLIHDLRTFLSRAESAELDQALPEALKGGRP
jgi:purine-binding chemotaxis protein CheW